MFSTRTIRRNLSTLVKKLGISDSKNNSYKKLATVEGSKKKTTQVSRGCVAMYVGEERRSYQVPVKYLSLPKFQELIIQSMENDLDIKVDGPITLACTTETFDQLLKLAKNH